MAHRITRTIVTCLKNGRLWVGQFVVDRDDLDFGDDRRTGLHGLARYVRARPLRIGNWMRARFGADHQAAEVKHAALEEIRAALRRLKLAA